MAFDPNSSRYRTCCCHVRKCTIAIGIVEALVLLVQLTDTVFNYMDKNEENGNYTGGLEQNKENGNYTDDLLGDTYNVTKTDPGTAKFASEIIGITIGVIVVVLLFLGVYKENRYLLIPHLITQINAIIGSVVLLIIFVISLVGPFRINWIPPIVKFTVFPIYQIWFFVVVLKCYRFFRDKERADGDTNPISVKYHATSHDEI